MNWFKKLLEYNSAESEIAAMKLETAEPRDLADLENMLFDACRVITQMRKEIDELDETASWQKQQLSSQSLAISNLNAELKALHTALSNMSKGGCNCDCNKTY